LAAGVGGTGMSRLELRDRIGEIVVGDRLDAIVDAP
jgi:hypothetical protein